MEVGQNFGHPGPAQGLPPPRPYFPQGEGISFRRPHPYGHQMVRIQQRGRGRGFGRMFLGGRPGGHESPQNGPPPRFGGPFQHHNRPPPFPEFHQGPPVCRPGFPHHSRHQFNMNPDNFRPGYPPNAEGNFNGFPGIGSPWPDQIQHQRSFSPQGHPQFQMGIHGNCPPNGKFFPSPPMTMDPPYIPQAIKHFPVLQLYKSDDDKEKTKDKEDEYCPLNPKLNVGNGYSKLKRGSTGSSGSLASSSSMACSLPDEDADSDSFGTGTDVFDSKMDSKKLEAIVQNFLKTSSPDSPKKDGVDSVDTTPIVIKEEDVDKKVGSATDIVAVATPVPEKSTDQIRAGVGQLVRTDDGFYCDEEGFVHVYTYGMMENVVSDVAKYGIWFGEGNKWNCGTRLTSGLQTGKGAHIQGATKAIAILKENGHSKIKISTDSTFMFTSVRKWAVKLINLQPGSPFEPSDWDEYKYANEIRQLCDSFSEAIVKWTLVDPKCDGTRRAKKLASPPPKTSFYKAKASFPVNTNTPSFKPSFKIIKDCESPK